MTSELFSQAQKLASKGRLKAARFALETAIEVMTVEDWAAINKMTFMEVMPWFGLLVETGLDETQEGPIREFYLDITSRALATAPEEIKADLSKKLDELFPELRKMSCLGCNDQGEMLYDLDATCRTLGVDKAEAIRFLEKRGGLVEVGKHQIHSVH
ncbi:MAG: hypothetical protein HQK57_02820 [Deltaproteobacteria bacterium]|nr:hypothetical protein [Deltaproteobacteria bacterium]